MIVHISLHKLESHIITCCMYCCTTCWNEELKNCQKLCMKLKQL